MKINLRNILSGPGRIASVGTFAALIAMAAHSGERPGGRAPAPAFHAAPAPVERVNHGTIRHVDTHVVQRPVEVARPAPVREAARPVERGEAPRVGERRPVVVPHRDVDVDVRRHEVWHDFAFHRHFGVLPFGYVQLAVGGVPYYYDDGLYYQAENGGYDEVYPPAGAEVPQPPAGAYPISTADTTYYYAGGAFYLQQPDGQYAVVMPPPGLIVPELPPGAAPVNINGISSYQFNGVNYQPMFVNGTTQYQTM
jgi:hypothetical protein